MLFFDQASFFCIIITSLNNLIWCADENNKHFFWFSWQISAEAHPDAGTVNKIKNLVVTLLTVSSLTLSHWTTSFPESFGSLGDPVLNRFYRMLTCGANQDKIESTKKSRHSKGTAGVHAECWTNFLSSSSLTLLLLFLIKPSPQKKNSCWVFPSQCSVYMWCSGWTGNQNIHEIHKRFWHTH